MYNKLGYGFLEKIYEKARMIELRKEKIAATAQSPIRVFYEDKIIGEYFADILVENKILLVPEPIRTAIKNKKKKNYEIRETHENRKEYSEANR